jgi:hypothetical protein
MDYALTVNDAGKDRWARDKVKNEKILGEYIKLDAILTLSLTALCNLSYLSALGLMDQRGQCILFSVVFTPSPPSHHGSVWVLPVISLLTLNRLAGLPNHIYNGRGFVGPKKKTIVGLLVFNPLWIGPSKRTTYCAKKG